MGDANSLEIELKLDLDESSIVAIVSAIEAGGARLSASNLQSVYFDTPDFRLRKAGLSLRIRRAGARRVQTLKAEGAALGALLARPEWECATRIDVPAFDQVPEPFRVALPKRLDTLAPAFSLEVARRKGVLRHASGRIEVVIDQGVVHAGGREHRFVELELELKDGTPSALFMVARSLAEAAPVKLGMLTKAERGYRLLDGTADRPSKSEPAAVAIGMPTGEAFASIAGACIRQFRLNEALLLRTAEPDALHQARVALRRLRSALSIFRAVVSDDRYDDLAEELRWLAATLGEVRDIDVLIANVGQQDQLGEPRADAYGRVTEALSSPRACALMLDLAEWLAIGAWRTTLDSRDAVRAPVEAFAATMLERLRRKLKSRGKRFRSLDDEGRHAVRIAAKKLRYAADFFATLFPSAKAQRRARRFIEVMEKLQTNLGELNDIATADLISKRLDLTFERDVEWNRKRLIKASGQAYEELIDLKRFW